MPIIEPDTHPVMTAGYDVVAACASPAGWIDHTLLSAAATCSEIEQLCEDAVEWGCAAVCIAPVYVALAARLLHGSEVAVGTVAGFPLGFDTTAVKVYAAAQACALGATEVDMVIHAGQVQMANWAAIEAEISAVNAACEGRTLKVIIECCRWSEPQKRQLVDCVINGGAAYVKTSSGFAEAGATVADVALLSALAAGRIGVKAAGGIRDYQQFNAMRAAGATRIGSSATRLIMQQWLDGWREHV